MRTIVFEGDAYITGGITMAGANDRIVDIVVSENATDNIKLVMNRKIVVDRPHYFSFKPNSAGFIAHVINFHSSNTTCSDSNTVPSSTVSSCLTNAQAMASATNDAYAAISTSNVSVINVDWSGMTFFAYYSRVNLDCALMRYDVAGIIAQGLGGCNSMGGISITQDNPNFGVPIPDTTSYELIDFTQR